LGRHSPSEFTCVNHDDRFQARAILAFLQPICIMEGHVYPAFDATVVASSEPAARGKKSIDSSGRIGEK
jgi:hypothetical protein